MHASGFCAIPPLNPRPFGPKPPGAVRTYASHNPRPIPWKRSRWTPAGGTSSPERRAETAQERRATGDHPGHLPRRRRARADLSENAAKYHSAKETAVVHRGRAIKELEGADFAIQSSSTPGNCRGAIKFGRHRSCWWTETETMWKKKTYQIVGAGLRRTSRRASPQASIRRWGGQRAVPQTKRKEPRLDRQGRGR